MDSPGTTIMATKVSLLGIMFLALSIGHSVDSALLGEPCIRNSDCKAYSSECDPTHEICTCKAYSVQVNSTTCLPGSLLGFSCETDAQCRIKVPHSGCVNGVCACGDGYVPYRRHTCLSPSKHGDICFENDQCSLADRGSYCKFVLPKVFGRCQCQVGKERSGSLNKCIPANIRVGEPCQEDGDCSMANAYCHRKLDGKSVCTCDVAYTPSSDRARCLPTYRGLLSPASLGYPCRAHLQCQLADPNSICNHGVCDCVASRNSMCSSKNTGCPKHTFQCESDGKCISWFFVCDSKKDCADGSDELCDYQTSECPRQAFQCDIKTDFLNGTGESSSTWDEAKQQQQKKVKCISRSRVCDGRKDCPGGLDEHGCTGKDTCPLGTFQCATTKECLPEFRFCNAIADCKDLSDESEKKCRVEFQPSDFCPFRCDNGLCRSSAVVCSGVDGCGDNSDEKNCQVCRCPRVSSPSYKKQLKS